MRNYVEFFYTRWNHGGQFRYTLDGSIEENTAANALYQAQNPADTIQNRTQRVFMEMNKANLINLLYSWANSTNTSPLNSPPIYMVTDSPRGKEKRRFRLVPIK